MNKKIRKMRVVAVALCMAMLSLSLTGCFKQPILYEGSDQQTSAHQTEDAASVATQTEETSGEPSPPPISEFFSAGVEQVLLKAIDENDTISSAHFDILLNPGKQSGDMSTYSNTTLHLYNDEGTDGTYTIEQINNIETGGASFVLDAQTSEGDLSQCALYFYDNLMLVNKANVESPLVLHSLNTQIADSYMGLSALERFNRVLNNTTVAKLSDDEWKAAVDTYIMLVTDTAKEPDYSTAEETATYAGMQMDCTASTLKLMGERGVTVVRELVSLIAQDTVLKSLFNSVYMVGEEEYGVTGLDGVLRDIDALDFDARKAAVMTFKLIEADVPIGIYIVLTAGDKSFEMNLTFYEDGYLRENDIIFTGFDGSSAVMQDVNVSNGGDTYTESIVYKISGPDGYLQENMIATIQSTITQSGYDAETQYAYSRVATVDMDAMNITASFGYTQTNSSNGVDSTALGTIDVDDGEAIESFNMEMTSTQSFSAIPVTPLEFLSTYGITTADQQGLYEALGDFDGASYYRAPLTTQLFASMMLLYN